MNKKTIKEKYKNCYFIIGNAYAGKSTITKELAKKYNGILCEENYHDRLESTLTKDEFPNLCYTRDLVDFHDFIRRTPDEYEKWVKGVSHECEILELRILDELVKSERLVFVDTNISINTLKEISDNDHVLVMLTDPNISVTMFFEREDREKQYLYRLILDEVDPNKALDNFRECLKRINNEETYNEFFNSGFNVLIKDDNRSIEDTLEIVSKLFKLDH